MSTITKEFTKEQLQQIEAAAKEVLWPVVWSEKKARQHFSEKITPEVVLGLARIALASLEAEPVGEVVLGEYDDCGCHPNARVACIAADGQADWENFKDGTRLFTAPPAPVVPDEATPDNIQILASTYAPRGFTYQWDSDECNAAADSWNACRTAMLQGAEPVTTAYKLPEGYTLVPVEPTYQMCEAMGLPWESPRFPDRYKAMIAAAPHFRENAETSTKCWCRTCRPITLTDMRFVVCPVCGNKRCPHANDHRNACSGSNEPGQEGSAYPAAPQQEVK